MRRPSMLAAHDSQTVGRTLATGPTGFRYVSMTEIHSAGIDK